MYGSALPRPSTTKPVAAPTSSAATSSTRRTLPRARRAGAAIDRLAAMAGGILGDAGVVVMPSCRYSAVARASGDPGAHAHATAVPASRNARSGDSFRAPARRAQQFARFAGRDSQSAAAGRQRRSRMM